MTREVITHRGIPFPQRKRASVVETECRLTLVKARIPAIALVGLVVLGLVTPGASAQTTVACEQDYTAVAGDWLSTIADKFYGDVSAYRVILLATNQKAETDPSYAHLDDPNTLAVGAKLCIPSAEDATALLASITPVPNTPTPTLAPGETPAPAAAAQAAATAPASIAATRLTPADITFDSQGLGKEIVGSVVPAVPYSNDSPPIAVGAPEHIEFAFDGEPSLWIIPTQAYEALWNSAGNSLISQSVAQLRTLLAQEPANPALPLPFLPPGGGVNDLAAKIQYVDFDGGSGIAYIGRWAQDPSPVLAYQTYYSFLGLTNDGKYIVSFRMPVHTSRLPDTPEELTAEHLQDIEKNPDAYFAETTTILNELAPSAFGPDLRRLDALVKSLHVPSAGQPRPHPTTAPTGSAGASKTITPSPTLAGGGAGKNTDPLTLRSADWKWVETTSPSGTLTVDTPAKYTIRFNNAGGFGIGSDCNIGAGNYKLDGGAIQISGLMSTQAFCGDESLDSKFSKQLQSAESFYLEGGNLFIVLAADGGTMKFVP